MKNGKPFLLLVLGDYHRVLAPPPILLYECKTVYSHVGLSLWVAMPPPLVFFSFVLLFCGKWTYNVFNFISMSKFQKSILIFRKRTHERKRIDWWHLACIHLVCYMAWRNIMHINAHFNYWSLILFMTLLDPIMFPITWETCMPSWFWPLFRDILGTGSRFYIPRGRLIAPSSVLAHYWHWFTRIPDTNLKQWAMRKPTNRAAILKQRAKVTMPA